MSDAALIRRLREENDELRETIRQMQERERARASGPMEEFPLEWRLPPTIKTILSVLSEGHVVPLLRLWEIAAERYPTSVGADRLRSSGGPDDPIGIIRVQVSKHRRALAALGIEIKNKWGVGYYLPPESLEVVRNALGRGSRRSDQQEQ